MHQVESKHSGTQKGPGVLEERLQSSNEQLDDKNDSSGRHNHPMINGSFKWSLYRATWNVLINGKRNRLHNNVLYSHTATWQVQQRCHQPFSSTYQCRSLSIWHRFIIPRNPQGRSPSHAWCMSMPFLSCRLIQSRTPLSLTSHPTQ